MNRNGNRKATGSPAFRALRVAVQALEYTATSFTGTGTTDLRAAVRRVRETADAVAPLVLPPEAQEAIRKLRSVQEQAAFAGVTVTDGVTSHSITAEELGCLLDALEPV